MLWLQENINKNIKKYAVSFIWVKAKQLIIKNSMKGKIPSKKLLYSFQTYIFFLISLKYQVYLCYIPLVKNGTKCESIY